MKEIDFVNEEIASLSNKILDSYASVADSYSDNFEERFYEKS